jgi:ABC-type branched-subunit amino acid transport system ATPase component
LREVEGVTKTLVRSRVVDDVSFNVEAGEIFGVAGPNGSGKSTLFNLITGIPFGPDRGVIRLDGQEIQGKSSNLIARMGLTRTFQRETSFDGLTVLFRSLLDAGASVRRADPDIDGQAGRRVRQTDERARMTTAAAAAAHPLPAAPERTP